jgi:hypothetical protein
MIKLAGKHQISMLWSILPLRQAGLGAHCSQIENHLMKEVGSCPRTRVAEISCIWNSSDSPTQQPPQHHRRLNRSSLLRYNVFTEKSCVQAPLGQQSKCCCPPCRREHACPRGRTSLPPGKLCCLQLNTPIELLSRDSTNHGRREGGNPSILRPHAS